jgi:vacuolar-type H+-ATPase subunit I/STV1
MRDHVAALIKRVLEQDAEIKRLEAEKIKLENGYVELSAIVESIYDCLDGKEPSDFMQSYPAVDSVWLLKERCKELEADKREIVKSRDVFEKENEQLEAEVERLKCCGNCKAFSNCHFMLGGAVDIGIKLPASSICDKWEERK